MVTHYTVYDIETEPFSEKFKDAKDVKSRLKNAPKPRVMVVYSSESDKYHPFTFDQLSAGVEMLLSSDVIVSYNGETFDELVLIKSGHLSEPIGSGTPKSLDLLKELNKFHGYRAKLGALAKLNFGEKKHTLGRKMSEIVGEELIEACKSDVSQTKRLYEMYLQGIDSIKYPTSRQRNYLMQEAGPAPFDHLATGCFECGSPWGFFVQEDTEDMTDGQLAEYMAGTWGFWQCMECLTPSFREM